MAILGVTLRVIEVITVGVCGIMLAVPPGHFRWEHVWTKIIFLFLAILWLAFNADNVYWFKFSSIQEVISACGLFLLLIIFFNTYFWQLFVQFFVYNYTVYIFRFLYVFTLCYVEHIHMQQYITVSYGVEWHWIQIAGMMITIIVSVCLCYYLHGKPMIQRNYKKEYRYLAVFVIMEMIIGQLLFNNDIAGSFIRGEYILFSLIVFVCLFSILASIIFYKGYKDVQYQQQISDMNYTMLERQYEIIQKMYTEKRMLLHDAIHQDTLILEYLKKGQYEKAQRYFEKKIAATKKKSQNRYTGIEVLDLMLNYEMEQADMNQIHVNCALEAYRCPLDETELCIIIGNLFDNAIEAVKNLTEAQRKIEFSIYNPNDIFRIEIANPYEGEREKKEHQYLTTKKENKEMHGRGLMSIQKIVEKYDGFMDISDDAHVFRVTLVFCLEKE